MIDDNNISDRKLIQGIDDDTKVNENLSFKFAHMGVLSYAQPVVNLKDLSYTASTTLNNLLNRQHPTIANNIINSVMPPRSSQDLLPPVTIITGSFHNLSMPDPSPLSRTAYFPSKFKK